MPQAPQFDSGELASLALPYDVLKYDLSNDIRFTGGANCVVTAKGKLAKRPGTLQFTSGGFPNGNRVDRLLSYETLDTPSKIFLVASAYNIGSAVWQAWYWSDQAGSTWTNLGSYRSLNASAAPHNMVVSRGLCWIKGYPAAATGEKLGTVMFDGSTLQVDAWGLLGPTIAAHTTSSGTWTASTFPVTVNIGWQYVYTWKNLHGHESNRSPLETNPANPPSNTGAFTNLCPSLTLQGNADTAHVPYVVIYRTVDGGGSFFRVEQVTNPGSGNFTYTDRHFNDGTTNPAQPFPDAALDTTLLSPTLTSNSPPPAVASNNTTIANLTTGQTSTGTTLTLSSLSLAPTVFPYTLQVDNEVEVATSLVSGTTVNVTRAQNGTTAIAHTTSAQVAYTPITGLDPIQISTPVVGYSGRLWYGIGSVLFYSANEELSVGVPEDAWPSGLFGNFYRLQHPMVNVVDTSEAMYALTTDEVWWLRGTSLSTFFFAKLYADLGARRNNPLAVTRADKSIIWLTNDLRLCLARGPQRAFLSDALGAPFRVALGASATTSLALERYQHVEKDWLLALLLNTSTTSQAMYVYDFNQTDEGSGIWNIPWTPVSWTAVAAGRNVSTSTALPLINLGTWDGTHSGITTFDLHVTTANTFTTVTDFVWSTSTGGAAQNYGPSFQLSPVRNPTGNHLNPLRVPGMVSVLHAVKIDRTAFAGDTDPTFAYALDSAIDILPTTSVPGNVGQTPPRRVQSVGYDTLLYETGGVACERVTILFSKAASAENFEAQKLAWIWSPDAGA